MKKIPKLTGHVKSTAQSISSQLLPDASINDDELATPATTDQRMLPLALASTMRPQHQPLPVSANHLHTAEREERMDQRRKNLCQLGLLHLFPPTYPGILTTLTLCFGGEINASIWAYWAMMDLGLCQNKEADVSASGGQYKRQKKHLFQQKLANGESVPREWLLYSPYKRYCILFCLSTL